MIKKNFVNPISMQNIFWIYLTLVYARILFENQQVFQLFQYDEFPLLFIVVERFGLIDSPYILESMYLWYLFVLLKYMHVVVVVKLLTSNVIETNIQMSATI